MPAERAAFSEARSGPALTLVDRCAGVRVLTWHGEMLYASRGYELVCGTFDGARVRWRTVGRYRPPLWRALTCRNRLSFRLVRDGFHALAVLPSGHLIGAVPGAIVTLKPGKSEFVLTHRITRGTRPLHITATPEGKAFFGEYFNNASRDEVHIYGSADCGASWQIAYTFPRGAIRHVHNIVHDPWEHCLWVFTGDNGGECRILRASPDLKMIDTAMSGNQQARAVAAVPASDGLYFASDTPLEANHVYRLDRRGNVSVTADLESSSIEGCRVGDSIFFSTMVEPSEVNSGKRVRLYGSVRGETWRCLLEWQKDRWPMQFFQYGNAFVPTGENQTDYLAVSTVAVEDEDLVTSIYKVERGSE